jgi:proteinaceous RNase P
LITNLLFQESEQGSWHVPLASETNDESSRTWLCITRPGSQEGSENGDTTVEAPKLYQLDSDEHLLNSSNMETVPERNNLNGNSSENFGTKSQSVTGKRKER